jgi:hypothetical protein
VTSSEYAAAYSAARRNWPKLTAQAMKKIKQAYETAAENIARFLRDGAILHESKLTFESQVELERQLRSAAQDVANALQQHIPESIAQGYSDYQDIDMELLLDALGPDNAKITAQGLDNLFTGVDRKIVSLTASRVWSDGYTFSARVWKIGEAYQENIKDILNVGFAENRDLVDIAGDLTAYVKDGKKQLVKRWGNLERGSKEFARRIPDLVDARALRLARSELTISLQEAAKENGRINPASNGLYDWIRLNTQQHDCACPRYAAGSPYTLQTLPSFPHPHCVCQIRPQMRDIQDFKTELRNWINGEPNSRLDAWKRDVYDPAQAA